MSKGRRVAGKGKKKRGKKPKPVRGPIHSVIVIDSSREDAKPSRLPGESAEGRKS